MTPRDELEWFFGACESEMGLKSNFSSLVLALKLARPPGPPPAKRAGGKRLTRKEARGQLVNLEAEGLANEDAVIDALDQHRARSRLAATAQNRRVMWRYGQLEARPKIILEAAFDPRQLPPEVRQAFGDAAGVVHLTPAALANRRFTMRWLAAAVVRRDAVIPKMKAQAQALLEEALQAYAATRRAT